ncbi:RNA polymerase sigma factor [Prosthecobacter sp.]|uniref:RNA polymerase sigma factor n=1 Tax=Prosthecobacter sp. TaxID=1965333 RepID=UPI003783D1AD
MDSDLTNDFCRTHWSRLYSLARQRGCDPHSAEDAVQEVFLSLVRRQKIADLVVAPLAQQQTHLAVSLRCRIANAIRDQHREKRGGMAVFVSLDDLDIADERTPPAALPDLRKALEALRKEMKPDAWSKLSPALLGDAPCRQQTGAYRVALCRARRRLKQLVNEASTFPCRAGR